AGRGPHFVREISGETPAATDETLPETRNGRPRRGRIRDRRRQRLCRAREDLPNVPRPGEIRNWRHHPDPDLDGLFPGVSRQGMAPAAAANAAPGTTAQFSLDSRLPAALSRARR